MIKKIFAFSALALIALHQSVAQHKNLESFPLTQVSLLDGPFYQAQQTDIQYILTMDPDRLLAPFVKEAGLKPNAKQYGNWESTGLDGHIGGHYLSALALMYASTHNEELLERLDYMVDVLAQCQGKNGNGYVGGIPNGQEMWAEIGNGKINAGGFSLNDRWVPLYNIHKLFAGLRDAYLIAGNEQAKEVLIKLTDWLLDITSGLSDDQIQEMLRSEHGGMNEVLADVAAVTGEEKYLTLAEQFSHEEILEPLVDHEDKLTGMHANTQIPKVIGFKRVADLSNNVDWDDAAGFFWESVVGNRTVSIGGNSVREHFNPVDDFSSMIESNQGPETCNTYNMLRLTQMLFLSEPQAKYMDYYERALYNHILSSQHPDGGFVYFTPMRPRHYRVYSQPHESFWCCVGSGLENHGKYGEMIYAHQGDDIYVNLFIASSLNWKEGGISLTQETRFPFEENSEITLDLDKPKKFTLFIRKPGWVADSGMEVLVNGKAERLSATADSYMAIERKWRSGDVVSVNLPMQTEVEYLPADSSWVSFVHGPVVLAAPTDSTDLEGLWANDGRMAHVAAGKSYPIEEAPLIVAEKPGEITSHIKAEPGATLTFTVDKLVYPGRFQNLKLVPFYQIHEARYMIYWPVVDRENLEKRMQAIREKEKKTLALEARTVDQVAPGEQQPESDHNFKGKETNAGVNSGNFWRDAKGWFSYKLSNEKRQGEVLRITYFGLDSGRRFDILLNDKLLTTVALDGSKGDQLFDVDYEIPEELLAEDMTLKFVAHEGSVAGGIYYVRLLRE